MCFFFFFPSSLAPLFSFLINDRAPSLPPDCQQPPEWPSTAKLPCPSQKCHCQSPFSATVTHLSPLLSLTLLQTQIRSTTFCRQWHPPKSTQQWSDKGRRHLGAVGSWWTRWLTDDGAVLCGDWGGLSRLRRWKLRGLWWFVRCVVMVNEWRHDYCGGRLLSSLLFYLFILCWLVLLANFLELWFVIWFWL